MGQEPEFGFFEMSVLFGLILLFLTTLVICSSFAMKTLALLVGGA